MHVLTRQDLFERAWARPLVHVAAELGVTSTGLKKICDRHAIPTPSRGYWRAVETGQTFKLPKLPLVKDKRLEQVRVIGSPPLPEVVQKAQDEAKARAARTRPPQPPKAPAPVAAEASPPLVAPAPAEPPQPAAQEPPVLAATRKAWLKARPTNFGFLRVQGKGVVRADIGEASVERGLAFLAALARAADAQGYEMRRTDAGMALVVDGDEIPFRMAEKPKKTLHEPKAKELAEKARREKWEYISQRDPWPTWDETPSGALRIVIDANEWSGLRKTFTDGLRAPLDAKLDDILAAFAGHAALVRQRREEREQRQREADAAAARREREAAFAEREGRRLAFVDAIAKQLEARSRLEAVLAHLDQEHGPFADRLEAMKSWIELKVAEIDARLSPHALDISARQAEVQFDEGRLATAERRYWHRHEVELHLWAVDHAAGVARVQSTLDWMLARRASDVEELNSEDAAGGRGLAWARV